MCGGLRPDKASPRHRCHRVRRRFRAPKPGNRGRRKRHQALLRPPGQSRRQRHPKLQPRQLRQWRPPEIRKALAASAAPSEPEVRRAKPVTSEDKGTPQETTNSSPAESGEQNRVAIRPLKRTYVKVTVGDKGGSPAFERWVSPADGPVEIRGKHVSIRVLDPDAVQITKNGKALEDNDEDVTVNSSDGRFKKTPNPPSLCHGVADAEPHSK